MNTASAHTHTHTHTHTQSKANTLCMEFHNGRSSFPNLHFQGQAASGALVDCVSKVWWNHTSLTSRYCTLLSNQTLCLTNIRKQPAGNIKMTQWARTSAGNIIRNVEAARTHRRTHTPAPVPSHHSASESPRHCNERQISAYSCITHTLILFCVVITP